jgi:hypothetical protein
MVEPVVACRVNACPETIPYEVPTDGARVTSLAARAGVATKAELTRANAAPSARPLRVMFLAINLSFFLVSHKPFGFMGCKRELPPTKQEISHPYM